MLALHKAGISKNQVTFLQVPFPDMGADLADGTVQAVNTIVPFNGQLLGEGYVPLGDPMFSVTSSGSVLDIGWGANATWALAHKSVVNAFIKAQKQAVAWIKTHASATETILEKQFQLPAVAAAHYPLYQYFSFGISASDLTDWIAPMKAVGDLPTSFSPKIGKYIY